MVEKEFSLGGISQIVFMVSTVVFTLSWIFMYHRPGYWFPTTLAAYAIFIVFCILFLISVRTIAQRFKGFIIGKVGAVFGLITGIIGTLLFILWGFSSEIFPFIDGFTVIQLLRWSWLMVAVSVGGTAILVGLFFIAYFRRVSNSWLWVVSGIVFVIAGAVHSYFYSYFFNYPFIFAIPWTRVAISFGSIIVGSIAGAFAFFAGKPVGKPVEDMGD